MRTNSLTFIEAVFILATISLIVGCGKSLPQIVPVSGVVTLDGKPLYHAEVRFIPVEQGLDGNMVGAAVTDQDGKYTLRLPGRETPGSCAVECAVTINEGPMPAEIREGPNEQVLGASFRSSLTNRPIPKIYTRMADTPLRIKVTAEQTDYPLELTR